MNLAWKIGLGIAAGGGALYVLGKVSPSTAAKIPGVGGLFTTPAKATPQQPYSASNPSTTGAAVAITGSVLQNAPGIIKSISDLWSTPSATTSTSVASAGGTSDVFTSGDVSPPPYIAAAADTSASDSYNPFDFG